MCIQHVLTYFRTCYRAWAMCILQLKVCPHVWWYFNIRLNPPLHPSFVRPWGPCCLEAQAHWLSKWITYLWKFPKRPWIYSYIYIYTYMYRHRNIVPYQSAVVAMLARNMRAAQENNLTTPTWEAIYAQLRTNSHTCTTYMIRASCSTTMLAWVEVRRAGTPYRIF